MGAPLALILFLAFLIVPLIEIATFIQVGGLIGVWPTIATVIITAVLGAWLWRLQGLSTLRSAQEALNRGELPVREISDGAFLLVAGALLLTPGFVTDAVGFALLIPPVRHVLARWFFRHMQARMEVHVVRGGPRGPHGPHGRGPNGRGGPVIDGEATTIDDEQR